MNLLIDTNIPLYLFMGDANAAQFLKGQVLYVSFVTELELLGYSDLTPAEERTIQEFFDECVIIDINKQIKNNTILLRKKYNLKLPDCIIVATAQYLGMPFFTADKDFQIVEEINLILYNRT